MNRKLGPLPAWAWLLIITGVAGFMYYRSRSGAGVNQANQVDPNSPMGLTYGQEAADQAQGIDPLTGQTYAQETAAGAGSGGGGSGSATPFDPTSLEDEITGLQTQITTLQTSGQPVPDQNTPTPVQTFGGELGDLATGITALTALEAVLAPKPATTTGAKGKGSGLSSGKAPAKGAIPLHSGSKKPTAPKGYKVVGTGKGNWWAVPNTSTTGSGNAGKTGSGTTRRTTTHKSTETAKPAVYKPAKKVIVSGGKRKK